MKNLIFIGKILWHVFGGLLCTVPVVILFFIGCDRLGDDVADFKDNIFPYPEKQERQ